MATAPKVDVGALAADIQRDATDRLASILVTVPRWLEDDGRELDELQQTLLVASALRHFDGFERSVYRALKRTLTDDGVEVWGASKELAANV